MAFANKVVIITGASAGIGATAARLFAEQSAKVVLVGRNEVNLKKVAEICKKAKGIEPLIVKAELSNDDDVKKIVTETVKAFGRIDVLVNNAGVGTTAGIKDGMPEFDKVLSCNLRSVYLLIHLAVPHLTASKGNIVNVSSVAAFKPIIGFTTTPYCISKAGLDQLTKCVALELASEGVRVNSVNPGGTITAFAEHAGLSKEESEKMYEERGKTYPLKKMAQSEEVAEVILFLASDKAKSTTGSVYVVDNGELLL